ncbi:MAG: esterase-like activity of phytase family protein [Roseicyclus sp.]
MARTALPLVLLLAPGALAAQEMVPATLAGHAALPAFTFSAPPEDAPAETWISGRFTGGTAPVNAPQSLETNGQRYPFFGQPLQGISGYALNRSEDGAIWALIDNGFGSKANSSDALLSFTRLAPDFETGTVDVLERVWLRDPDHVVPFRIVHEATGERYLTGADFDPESIQVVGDTVHIGEEFGPYLITATRDGVVTGVHSTMLEGEELRSPDHPALRIPAEAGAAWRVPRSRGFEGMAMTPDGSLLWAMLEGAILDAEGNSEDGTLRVMAFDPEAGEWTGDHFRFRFTEGASAIGDFNFIDETRALVIERDGGEGHPSLACAEGQTEGCFANPARVKRITLIDTASIDADGFVERVAQIDLMDIADPQGLSRLPTDGEVPEGRFAFPFVTIESVIRDGEEHILVGNDNNLPFSAGRQLGVADSNEMIRLHVPELLAAN